MEILKIKLSEDGYTKEYTNGAKANKSGDYSTDNEVKEWLLIDGNIVEPKLTEVELQTQATQIQINTAQAYLDSTDFKMTIDYDQDTTTVKALRSAARITIRTLSTGV